MMAGGTTPDPQWALTLAIRTALEMHGQFEAEVDTRDRQSIVDLHWAGMQAGRLLGTKVKVDIGPTHGPRDHTATVTVCCVADGGAGRVRVQEGLQRLRRQVACAQVTISGQAHVGR